MSTFVRQYFKHPHRGDVHHRDDHGKKIDVKRAMRVAWLTLLPITLFAMYNIGYQALEAFQQINTVMTDWRYLSISQFGTNPDSIVACFAYGALQFFPIYAIAFMSGYASDLIIAKMTNGHLNRGFAVTALVFTLTLPPTLILWKVALGISFGVLITHLITNSRHLNMFNPALIGRAFICLLYPTSLSGTAVWTAVDGFTGATPLGMTAANIPTHQYSDMYGEPITWGMMFIGNVQGAMGETSALLVMMLSIILIKTRVAFWRVMAGGLLGLIATSSIINFLGYTGVIEKTAAVAMPFYWHIVVGSFAFGLVFMATDPISAPKTLKGRWLAGVLIGSLTVLIRVFHPTYAEGVMWAILITNLCVPMIDYLFYETGSKTNHMNSINIKNIWDKDNIRPLISLSTLASIICGFAYLMLS